MMHDDDVFAGRFRFQLTMFEVRILIGLSRLLHAHIAYEIVISKITSGNMHDVGNDIPCRIVEKPQFLTAIIETWMIVAIAKKLGTAGKCEFYIF